MSADLPLMNLSFEAIGTKWSIDIRDKIDKNWFKELSQKIKNRIEQFDKTYSRFRDDSIIMKASRKTGVYTMPEDAKKLFDVYEKLGTATNGKINLAIGNLLSDAGYDSKYSFKSKTQLKPSPKIDDVISYKHPHLTVHKPVILDFGAAGKGYLIDIIGELLMSEGVKSFIIDAGGDMLRRDETNSSVRIGLEDPEDDTQAIGVAQLANGSICGSAGNRRTWANLHHIMDPQLAQPVQNIIAVWAMADSAIIADGVATSLFFVEPEKLQEAFSFEYLLIFKDHTYKVSENFPAELFIGARK